MEKQKDIQFSIVVPAYNAEKYIDQCIQSVQEQTYENFELILVNDGSEDNTERICCNYAVEDVRIKVYHQENQGQTAARKNGLVHSSAKYVLFLDSDDWLERDTLERCCHALKEKDSQMIVFGSKKYTKNKAYEEPVPYRTGFYEREQIEKNIIPSLLMNQEGKFFPRALWGKVYEREFLKRHLNLIPEIIRNGEDMCCVISMVMECSTINILSSCLYCYRASDNQSVSRSGDKLALVRCQSIVSFLSEIIERNNWKEKDQLYRLIVQQMYSSAQRTMDTVGMGRTFKDDFNQLMDIPFCKEAVKKAEFSANARKLKVKQSILRYRLFPIMALLRKLG